MTQEKISKPDWVIEADKWKNGENVWSGSLGGIGPGHEQALQILLWEILVRWGNRPLPKDDGKSFPKEYLDFVDKAVSALSTEHIVNGLSGAQVKNARATAFQFMKFGYNTMMDKLPEDRKILVSKEFGYVN